MEDIAVHVWPALGGLVLGGVFGITVERTNFCMMGAVADLTLKGDTGRLRAWALAIAIALLGTGFIQWAGFVDLSATQYLAPRLVWGGTMAGGVMFGFGMVIACGCGSRALVNLGTGDLRALVSVLCLAVSAYITMRGLLALPRIGFQEATSLDLAQRGLATQSLPALLGFDSASARAMAAVVAAAVLLLFSLGDRVFRASRQLITGAVIIGVLVTAGWLVTGVLGADAFEPVPVVSLTFVAPVGEALMYLMTFTGAEVTFGVAMVGGVVLGAGVSSLARGRFALQAFEDVLDMGRYMVGGIMMGVGGVTALGCTVGQGITGVATLGAGSWLALAGIVCGGVLGVRYLEAGSIGGALRAVLART